ncbi:MAG: phosphoribosyltransferase family protein [Bacteroidota bacterium]
MEQIFSLHKIYANNEIPFSEGSYSRFKFGDGLAAGNFGHALGTAFVQQYHYQLLCHSKIVVLASPFSGIPTASFYMKNAFVRQLNRYLAFSQKAVVEEAKIYRNTTYRIDYGNLSAEERIQLIGNDSFYTDQHFLKDKFLIFIDDIRITGSHQKVIELMMQQQGMNNPHCFVYFAELANAAIHPNIENYLNYFEVKSLGDLRSFIFSNHFYFNTRVVKFLLSAEPTALSELMEQGPVSFAEDLADWAISNSYHTIPEYEHNFNLLLTIINKPQFYGNQSSKGSKREPERT